MAQITNFHRQVAAEQASTSITLVEVSNYTILFTELQTAGFAAGDVVLCIWTFCAGGNQTSNDGIYNIGWGTTFAAALDLFPVHLQVEDMDATTLNGGVHMGWVDQRTLVVNENLYYAQAMLASGIAQTSNFSCLIIKQSDLGVDDFRYDANVSAIAVDTNFTTGRDAQVTLPASGGGDWVILACGDWDLASVTINIEQRINVDGVATQMLSSREAEENTEQLAIMSVGFVASAAASQTVTFEGREAADSTNVLDRSRILALRLGAFESSQFSHTGSGGATELSTTLDAFTQIATISLSLTTTGPVVVMGQTIVDESTSPFDSDPYLRLQENNVDIVANMGRGTDHTRDLKDIIGVNTMVSASMNSGTRTIDMDVARDETAAASTNAVAWTLVAFSLELAAVAAGINSLRLLRGVGR